MRAAHPAHTICVSMECVSATIYVSSYYVILVHLSLTLARRGGLVSSIEVQFAVSNRLGAGAQRTHIQQHREHIYSSMRAHIWQYEDTGAQRIALAIAPTTTVVYTDTDETPPAHIHSVCRFATEDSFEHSSYYYYQSTQIQQHDDTKYVVILPYIKS